MKMLSIRYIEHYTLFIPNLADLAACKNKKKMITKNAILPPCKQHLAESAETAAAHCAPRTRAIRRRTSPSAPLLPAVAPTAGDFLPQTLASPNKQSNSRY